MKNNNAAQDNTNAVLATFDLQRFATPPVDPPAPIDPKPDDPVPVVDPVPADPKPADPNPVDPAPVDPKPADPAPVVPETYAAFTLPEGFQMDQEALTEFMPMAKELGMTQEAAQKAIELHTKAIGGIMGRMEAHREEAYTAVMAEVKADPAIGGTKYEANIGKINSVLNAYGGEGSADVFHAAVAQVAAFDPAKAKAMYTTLHSIAKAANMESTFVMGSTKVNQEFYPGLPKGPKLR